MIRVAVIGLGRIGSAYDYAASAGIRSHVGAILNTPGLMVAGLVDPDSARRAAAAEHWKHSDAVKDRIEALPADIDVAVICTPSAERLLVIERLLRQSSVRLLIVEKPLALTSSEAEKIAALADQRAVALRVNFQRRFSRRLAELHRSFNGETPRAVVARYGNGLHNYGSHLVDLLMNWFGPVSQVNALGPAGTGSDPVATFRCHMAAGFDAVAVGLDGLAYDQFDIELFFADRRVILTAGGAEICEQRGVPDRLFPGYVHLGPTEPLSGRQDVSDMERLWLAVKRHLQNGEQLGGCTITEAVAGLKVIEAVQRSMQNDGQTVRLAG